MNVTKTPIEGLLIIEPAIHKDDRGYFFESYSEKLFGQNGIKTDFVQDNESKSSYGVLRGLHYQVNPTAQAKMVRVAMGEVFDVAVDIRKGSPTYGKWYGTELTAENGRMLYVPEHCAHGHQTLEESAEILYMTSAYYTPSAVRGVRFDDPAFHIEWPLAATRVSEQDRSWPLAER